MQILNKIFGNKQKNTNVSSESMVEYYYNTIVESSLQGLKFDVKEGKIGEKKLSKVNILFVNHEEENFNQYSDNLNLLRKHINKIKSENLKKYKVVYFPFIFKFLEKTSTNRADKYIASPIYFTYDLNESTSELLESLVEISINNENEEDIFKDANLVFNNIFASKAILSIYNEELEVFKSKLEEEEFENKFPNKNFVYFEIILLQYLEKNIGSKKVNADCTYGDIIKHLYNTIKNNANGFDKILELEYKSGIAIIDSEELLESDLMYKGLISAYKNSIIPFVSDKKNKNHGFNRVFYKHEKKLIEKNNAFEKSSPFNSLNLSIENILKLQQNHLGSFSSSFGLTVSQRLSFCSTISSMDVIPVNGPPGTGKTALLRAVFSNYIVNNAFKAYSSYKSNRFNPLKLIDTGKPILGTSSVRQAINNIISGISEGFSEAFAQGLEYERWLDLSHNLYNDVDLIDKFVVVPQIRNSEEKYENDILFTGLNTIFDYIESLNSNKLKVYYLNKFNSTYSQEYKDIKKCIDYIYKKMEVLKSLIVRKVTSLDYRNMDEESIFKYLEKLDKTDRFELFFTSIHLLEAFFILNIEKLNKQSNNTNTTSCVCPLCESALDIESKIACTKCGFELEKDEEFRGLKPEFDKKDLALLLNDSLLIEEQRYGVRYNLKTKKYNVTELFGKIVDIEKLYLLSPLFPMLSVTMHSLFGAFKIKNDDNFIIEKDFFDLVLTDESGMILAPIALPALFVAKKMVVVGDEKQIEPIYPFDKIVDRSIFNTIRTSLNYKQFYNDYSILNLNFIRLINRSTYFDSFEMKSYEENNLWLKEHFRCKDEIIEYCNEIIYKGILIPKVRTFSQYLFLDKVKEEYPSIKIFNLDSKVYKNSSDHEAMSIADYLINNIEKLTYLYNQYKYEIKKDDEEVKSIEVDQFYKKIGIVTPFNNQKFLIQKTLPKEFNLNKILIGTVHAFQGSEKEIIIFSPSIGSDCNYEHFTNKDDGNMMNVAVSRAKSAFWVFGSVAGMEKAGAYTEVLSEYIKNKEDYEIVDKLRFQVDIKPIDNKLNHLSCPLCESSLVEMPKVFKCSTQKFENGKQSGCKFTLFKKNKAFGRELDIEDVYSLLNDGIVNHNNTSIILDLKNKFFTKLIKDEISIKKKEESIIETERSFRKAKRYIYKDFRGTDLTLEEAEKILNGETIKVKRVSKVGNDYEINIWLEDGVNGKLSAGF